MLTLSGVSGPEAGFALATAGIGSAVVLNLVLASARGGLHPVLQMGLRLGVGVAVGLVAAALLVFSLARFLVTDDMEAAVSVLVAAAAFAVAEVIAKSGKACAMRRIGLQDEYSIVGYPDDLLHFYKMNGAGNDFVVVDNRDLSL